MLIGMSDQFLLSMALCSTILNETRYSKLLVNYVSFRTMTVKLPIENIDGFLSLMTRKIYSILYIVLYI